MRGLAPSAGPILLPALVMHRTTAEGKGLIDGVSA